MVEPQWELDECGYRLSKVNGVSFLHDNNEPMSAFLQRQKVMDKDLDKEGRRPPTGFCSPFDVDELNKRTHTNNIGYFSMRELYKAKLLPSGDWRKDDLFYQDGKVATLLKQHHADYDVPIGDLNVTADLKRHPYHHVVQGDILTWENDDISRGVDVDGLTLKKTAFQAWPTGEHGDASIL